MNRLAALCLVLLLAACSAPHEETSPYLADLAYQHHARGLQSVSQGRGGAARIDFAQAYRLYASLNDLHGMYATLINLAVLERRYGERPRAWAYLQQAKHFAPADAAGRLAFEEALLHLAEDDLSAAHAAALKSADVDRSLRGAALNLLARITMLQGMPVVAREHAEEVLALNRGTNDVNELANSHRLLGELALSQGDASVALDAYASALALDRQQGLPEKISQDLLGMADAQLLRGDRSEESKLLAQWFATNAGRNDLGGSRAALDRLAALLEGQGRADDAAMLRARTDEVVATGVLPFPPHWLFP